MGLTPCPGCPGLPRLVGLLWLAHMALFKLMFSLSWPAIHSVLDATLLPAFVHLSQSMRASPPPLSPRPHKPPPNPRPVHIPIPEVLLIFSLGGSRPCCSFEPPDS